MKELLPPEKPVHGGRPGKDNRVMFNGILHWMNTGIPWKDLPERYDPWFRRWSPQSIWEHIFKELIAQDIVEEKRGAIVVILSRKTARHPRDIDRHIYTERHLVENRFLKFNAHRRFVSRYEKRACLFFAATRLAAILVWIAWV